MAGRLYLLVEMTETSYTFRLVPGVCCSNDLLRIGFCILHIIANLFIDVLAGRVCFIVRSLKQLLFRVCQLSVPVSVRILFSTLELKPSAENNTNKAKHTFEDSSSFCLLLSSQQLQRAHYFCSYRPSLYLLISRQAIDARFCDFVPSTAFLDFSPRYQSVCDGVGPQMMFCSSMEMVSRLVIEQQPEASVLQFRPQTQIPKLQGLLTYNLILLVELLREVTSRLRPIWRLTFLATYNSLQVNRSESANPYIF